MKTESKVRMPAGPGKRLVPCPPLFVWSWAFTLVELLVVLGVIALLAALVLPALSKGKQTALSAACRNNLKQLQTGFLSYGHDNYDLFPSNNYVYAANLDVLVLGASWAPGNALLDLSTSNLEQGSIFPYVPAAAVFHCPADRSTTLNPATGALQPRVRSYSMNIWLNSLLEPNGARSLGEITGKPLSDVFVFIDTHQDSIGDAAFGIYQSNTRLVANYWLDTPADRHRQGANLSFLDGHVESWHWLAPKVFKVYSQMSKTGADRADLRRLQDALPPPRRR